MMCLPEDGRRPPKHVGQDWYQVYEFVCAGRWFHEMNYILLHGMNNITMTIYYLGSR